MFSLGLLLFEALTGESMCELCEDLEAYVKDNDLMRFFRRDSFSVVKALLEADEARRMTAKGVVQHQWFKAYLRRYGARLERKQVSDRRALAKRMRSADTYFPYYSL